MILPAVLLLLAALGAPLFVVLGGLAWLSFMAAQIDLAAIMIELYRLASAPTLPSIPRLLAFSPGASSSTPPHYLRL